MHIGNLCVSYVPIFYVVKKAKNHTLLANA
jgi:hypothetical protein